jgi:hypothetical protein
MPDITPLIRTEVILPPYILLDVSAQETPAANSAAVFNRETVLLDPAYVETVDGNAWA